MYGNYHGNFDSVLIFRALGKFSGRGSGNSPFFVIAKVKYRKKRGFRYGVQCSGFRAWRVGFKFVRRLVFGVWRSRA